jgi:hypothetical protein
MQTSFGEYFVDDLNSKNLITSLVTQNKNTATKEKQTSLFIATFHCLTISSTSLI